MPLIPQQNPPYYTTETTPAITQYIALLTQTGVTAPTAEIIQNNTDITTIEYISTGKYKINKPGDWTRNKTNFSITNNTTAGIELFAYIDNGNDFIIETYDAGALTDAMLTDTPITITIYP